MIVRPYESKDFEQVKGWVKQWGGSAKEEFYPKTGFIVDGVAAYFLYSTDSKVCWLENMISNKDAEQDIKNAALEMIIEAILDKAKELGFKVVYACTDNYSVARRSIKHGALVKPGQIKLMKTIDPS